MTKEQWDEWLRNFKNGLPKWQQEELDKSVELKLAVNSEAFSEAEAIAFRIAAGANQEENEAIKILNQLLD